MTKNQFVVKKILEIHPDKPRTLINSPTLQLKLTPVMLAVLSGNSDVVRLLLKHRTKPDLERKAKCGKTALDYAIQTRNENPQIWNLICTSQRHCSLEHLEKEKLNMPLRNVSMKIPEFHYMDRRTDSQLNDSHRPYTTEYHQQPKFQDKKKPHLRLTHHLTFKGVQKTKSGI
eukprot:TRINITY_DN4753_c0_g1_i1.p1 TRINITY_DN4753_c0_g1~~TRINITY_DN4753_c0_g1_i1.p1  ORF type:complete len:173 (-),score=27.76 TRINITY_DN4753_c0_g1_i1:347-865(-)